jgi:hypothetical protein
VPARSVRSLVIAALVVLGAAAPAGALAARPSTTGPDRVVTIHVKLTNRGITLSRTQMRMGDNGRFVVTNMTSGTRRFSVGKTSTRPIAPGAHRILLLGFPVRGDYEVKSVGAGAPVQRANIRIV